MVADSVATIFFLSVIPSKTERSEDEESLIFGGKEIP
jgi:hypothetical protein